MVPNELFRFGHLKLVMIPLKYCFRLIFKEGFGLVLNLMASLDFGLGVVALGVTLFVLKLKIVARWSESASPSSMDI